ncbi:MAG: hypothetical protein WAO98_05345 [Alphaproteobacteria bacterium]
MSNPGPVFGYYKPLRNWLKGFSLLESLNVVKAYAQRSQLNIALPPYVEVPQEVSKYKSLNETGIFIWDLEILAREILINCDSTGDKFLSLWRNFSKTLNLIKDLDNEITIHYRELHQQNIFVHLNRIAHRQFPWQTTPNLHSMYRYFQIYNMPDLKEIIHDALGITLNDIYIIGLILTGAYMKDLGFQVDAEVEPLVTRAAFDKFIENFSVPLEQMRTLLNHAQSYDENYFYSFNPMSQYPLIQMEMQNLQSLVCPIPTLLFNKITSGLYYLLWPVKNFDQLFGHSFELYTGKVLEACNLQNNYRIFSENEYGPEKKKTVDWIIQDSTGTIFLECKTKRMRLDAKVGLTDTTPLENELKKMGRILFQVYKTLSDALLGNYPEWKPTSDPVFPLVVTLENWHIFGDVMLEPIDNELRRLLKENNIDAAILDTSPYSICSIEEWELINQIIAKVGIKEVMSAKTEAGLSKWHMKGVMLTKFEEHFSSCTRDLFPEVAKQIHPCLEKHSYGHGF